MNFEQVIPFIFLIFLTIVLFLWVIGDYKETKKLFGRVAARRDLRRLIAIALCILIYFSIGFAIFSFFIKFDIFGLSIAFSTLMLPFALGSIGYASTWCKRRRLAGIVLLDLGQYFNPTAGILLGGFFITIATRLVFSAFSNNLPIAVQSTLQALIYAAILGCYGGLWILLSLSKIEIRERGICYPFFVITWEVIEAYRWIGSGRNTLCIRHQATCPFFPVLKFQISLAHKSRVEQLLLQYLPAKSNLT